MLIFVSSVVGRGADPVPHPDPATSPGTSSAPFALFWSLLFSLIDIRAIGTTGFRVDPPYVREGLIIAMKPKNIDIWFAPWPVALGSSSWVQHFKTAELTGCTPRSADPGQADRLPGRHAGQPAVHEHLLVDRPDPVGRQYPYTDDRPAGLGQPVLHLDLGRHAQRQRGHRQQASSASCSTSSGCWRPSASSRRSSSWARSASGSQLSLIGLAVGMVMPIPFAVSLFVGGLIAQYIRRKTGPEWFGANRNIIVAGLAVGEGVVIGLLAAIAALRSSLIALPY